MTAFRFPEHNHQDRKDGVQVLAGSRESLDSIPFQGVQTERRQDGLLNGIAGPGDLDQLTAQQVRSDMGSCPTGHRMTAEASCLWRKAMSEEKLRQQLYDSFANRAHVYHLLFRQLRSELGELKAT